MLDQLQKLKDLRENEPLAPHTTFKIGGPAKYFFVAKTNEDLVRAVNLALKLKIPYYILGGGSNLLVSDRGFDGLVIKIKNEKLKIKNNNIIAEGGVLLSVVVGKSVEAGLAGLEWAAGIPGTIGGAVYGNAGWPSGKESMGGVVEEVRSMNYEGRITKLDNKKCKFGYRDSIFKHNKDIILEVTLKIEKGDREKIKSQVKENLKKRGEKIPPGFSAGCIFKNVKFETLNQDQITKLNLPDEFKKKKIVSSGWLIDRLDLRGEKIGGAQISEKHANFIINAGGATADNVLALISLIKMKARDEFGIRLEEEIEYLGF